MADHDDLRVISLVLRRKSPALRYSSGQTRKEIPADFITLRRFRRLPIAHRNFADSQRNITDDIIQHISALAKRFKYRLRKRSVPIPRIAGSSRLAAARNLQMVKPLR